MISDGLATRLPMRPHRAPWCTRVTAALLLTLAAAAALAYAEAPATACPQHYADGRAPEITKTRLAAKTREICFAAFGVMHSGVSRTPLWSAEHVTQTHLRDAKGLERVNAFHAEERLPADERAELRDYARSGFDRGHLAPSADMPTPEAQQESFSLSNMVPQDPNNNRHLWEGIEAAVRHLVTQRGELYVITGPLFRGASLTQLHGRVLVPTHLFKAIYDPRRGEAAAYLVENLATMTYATVSLAELEDLAGLTLFPALPAAVTHTKMDLPEPHPHHGQSRPAASRSLLRELLQTR